MCQKTDAIVYTYIGPNSVCGIVDAMAVRGIKGGPSPFIFHHAPKLLPPGEGGPDYEDYVLNRTILTNAEAASNIIDLERDCALPADWRKQCGPDLDHPAAGKPRFCTLMAARNVLVLEAHPNGCPSE